MGENNDDNRPFRILEPSAHACRRAPFHAFLLSAQNMLGGLAHLTGLLRSIVGRLAVAAVLLVLALSAAALAQATQPWRFDHFATGYPLTGAHRSAPCESCHASGQFKGTPTRCSSCHNGTLATGKPRDHVPTRAQCDTCHRGTSTFSRGRMDHTGITSGCASCHNGQTATGKPANHIVTNAPCETCHRSTTTFSGARMDHTGIVSGCANCHNGVIAEGKPRDHPNTSAPCENCHRSTRSWD